MFDATGRKFRISIRSRLGCNVLGSAASFLAVRRLGVVHQNASHYASRHCVEVNPILPLAVGICQPQVGFMDKRRRTKGVIAPLRPQAPGGEAAKLVVD